MNQAVRLIHDALEQFGGTCPLDTVSALCPQLSDAQVFFAIDEMSRTGEVRLMRNAEGTYFVRTCAVPVPKTVAVS